MFAKCPISLCTTLGADLCNATPTASSNAYHADRPKEDPTLQRQSHFALSTARQPHQVRPRVAKVHRISRQGPSPCPAPPNRTFLYSLLVHRSCIFSSQAFLTTVTHCLCRHHIRLHHCSFSQQILRYTNRTSNKNNNVDAMKFLTYLVPAIAVIAPALVLGDCAVRRTPTKDGLNIDADHYQESCVSKAVSATQCDSSNVECVCDSYVFLEEVFECSTECGSDEDGESSSPDTASSVQSLTSVQLQSIPLRATAAFSTSAMSRRLRHAPMVRTASSSAKP